MATPQARGVDPRLLERLRNIGKAKITERGEYIPAGDHVLEVLRIIIGETRPPKARPFLVAEFKMLASTNPEVTIGKTYNYFQHLDEDWSDGNIKALMWPVCSGLNGSELEKEAVDFDAVVRVLNPVYDDDGKTLLVPAGEVPKGVVLHDHVVSKPNKDPTKKDNNYNNWRIDYAKTKANINPDGE